MVFSFPLWWLDFDFPIVTLSNPGCCGKNAGGKGGKLLSLI